LRNFPVRATPVGIYALLLALGAIATTIFLVSQQTPM
jgi:hypothetical protein